MLLLEFNCFKGATFFPALRNFEKGKKNQKLRGSCRCSNPVNLRSIQSVQIWNKERLRALLQWATSTFTAAKHPFPDNQVFAVWRASAATRQRYFPSFLPPTAAVQIIDTAATKWITFFPSQYVKRVPGRWVQKERKKTSPNLFPWAHNQCRNDGLCTRHQLDAGMQHHPTTPPPQVAACSCNFLHATTRPI